MGIEECSPSRRSLNTESVGKKCGVQYRIESLHRGVLVGIEELPSQAEEHRNGGIECRIKSRSANQN